MFQQFIAVIEAAATDQSIDLAAMPPHPSQLPDNFLEEDDEPSTPPPKSPAVAKATSQASQRPSSDEDIPDIDPSEVAHSFNAPQAPKTIMQALQQRLDKYKSTAEAARTAGDTVKARRLGRIVKQYQVKYSVQTKINLQDIFSPNFIITKIILEVYENSACLI